MNYLELLAALGLNVEEIKKKWLAWQAEHPGMSVPIEEVASELLSGLSESYIKRLGDAAANELVAFVQHPSGLISTGDDPSLMA